MRPSLFGSRRRAAGVSAAVVGVAVKREANDAEASDPGSGSPEPHSDADDLPVSTESEPMVASGSKDTASAAEGKADAAPSAVRKAVSGTGPSDEERLADELAALLARTPRRQASTTLRASAATMSETDDTIGSWRDLTDPADRTMSAPARPFVSALHRGPAGTAEDDIPATDARDPWPADTGLADGAELSHRTAEWIAAARRRRWSAGLRQAGSWVAAAVIGTLVVVAAALMLMGHAEGVASRADEPGGTGAKPQMSRTTPG